MEVSIITGPNKNLKVEKEIRLAKVGLLYSDKVTIVSPNLTLILMMLRMANLSEKEKLEFLRHVIPSIKPDIHPMALDGVFKEYQRLKAKVGKNKSEMIEFMRFRSMLNKFGDDINLQAEEMIMNSGLIEGLKHIENGTLALNIVDFGQNGNDFAQSVLDETVRLLSDIDSYPIFDETIEELANAWIKENKPNYESFNASEIKVGKEFLIRLPNLDYISFDNLINLKSDLHLPLEKFKSLIYQFSGEINSIPFSLEAKRKVDKMYQREVSPQLLEIQREIDSNKIVNHLVQGFKDSFAKYTVFLGIASVNDLQNILLGAGGVTLAETIIHANKERIKKKTEIENNSLYFYHKLSKY